MKLMITGIGILIASFATVVYAKSWYDFRKNEDLFWCVLFAVFGSHALYYLITEGP